MSRHADAADVVDAPPRMLRLLYLTAVCVALLVVTVFVLGAEPAFWLFGIIVLPASFLAYVIGGGQQGVVLFVGWALYLVAATALFKVQRRASFWIVFGALVALLALDATACHQQLVMKHLL